MPSLREQGRDECADISSNWPSYELLGSRVHALSISDLHAIIATEIALGNKCIIASQNLHGLYTAKRDPRMGEFYQRAKYVRIDGMPFVFWGQLLGYPIGRKHRVTWVDWLRPFLVEASQQGWRVFYLGSQPDIVRRGAELLRKEAPGIQLDVEHGYFDQKPGSLENEAIVGRINSFKPNILMVGMGMPRQERWILDNYDRLDVNVFLPCGACIDYFAGVVPTPPRWMARIGLEWFSRLMAEPRRLWRRYLIEPWFLADLFLRDLITVTRRRRKRQKHSKG